MKESGNAESVVSSKGVKKHVFEPSGKTVWTVVGKENEHWLDPDLEFCSCEDFYYNTMTTGRQCYHLKAVKLAKEQGNIEIIKFSDSEFDSFIAALVNDLI